MSFNVTIIILPYCAFGHPPAPRHSRRHTRRGLNLLSVLFERLKFQSMHWLAQDGTKVALKSLVKFNIFLWLRFCSEQDDEINFVHLFYVQVLQIFLKYLTVYVNSYLLTFRMFAVAAYLGLLIHLALAISLFCLRCRLWQIWSHLRRAPSPLKLLTFHLVWRGISIFITCECAACAVVVLRGLLRLLGQHLDVSIRYGSKWGMKTHHTKAERNKTSSHTARWPCSAFLTVNGG